MKYFSGQKFNKLTLKKLEKVTNNRYYWLCECDCGKQKIIRLASIVSGEVKSCGCLRKSIALTKFRKHGMYLTRFNQVFRGLKNRCQNAKNTAFSYYGGRGISCKWKNFNEFKKDMYESYIDHCLKYGEKQTTIDRVNNDGNYCKENCRWATWVEQGRNRKSYQQVALT